MYRKTYVEVNIDNLKNNVKNIVNYYNNYNGLTNCLKRYNEVLYPNIFISNILTNRSRVMNQYITIYKTINVQSVYSILEADIIFNIIKDKICLIYENNTIT